MNELDIKNIQQSLCLLAALQAFFFKLMELKIKILTTNSFASQ